MTTKEIVAKKEKILKRLKKHDAARELIQADLVYLQHICPHKNQWSDGGSYGGSDWSSTYCRDCGKLIR